MIDYKKAIAIVSLSSAPIVICFLLQRLLSSLS